MPTSVLPDPQIAYDNLFQGVHTQIFFQKLAAAGIVPRTQKEAETMLKTAGELRYLEEMEATKVAEDMTNPVFAADVALNRIMERAGIQTQQKQAAYTDQDQVFRQIARQAASDPTLYDSVLTMKAAEAQYLAAQTA